MATMANNDRETTQPTCQNCATSTTPLWRRDEMGSVLCNACGLFLKLHGRPRPISLKTDIIKSRNRVKTRPDLAKQKKQNQAMQGTGDMNGFNQNGARTASQKSNGHVDDTNSPISRTGTPNLYQTPMHPMYPPLDEQFQAQQLAGFSVAGANDGQAPSPLNDERLQSHEQLQSQNSQLKTRVSELEVIQELYRGRLQQLEDEEKLRQSQESGKIEAQLRTEINILTETQAQLRQEINMLNDNQNHLASQLEESHGRERNMKRRLDELEEELRLARQPKEAPTESEEDGHIAKKARIEEEAPPSAEVPTPQSVS
ncbi:GATA type zinc finger protein asd-4 [Rhypophila sp. PSN 637]